MARLGLRAGEGCSLQLEDIDWEAGSLTVRGKGDCSTQLPLPADVGKAIAAYLKDGREHSLDRSVFWKTCAPVTNLNSGSIGLIANKALARAGITGCSKGAHQFRHALATKMLRQGASSAEIGDILRQRNPQTTSIYAKVDIASLRTLSGLHPSESCGLCTLRSGLVGRIDSKGVAGRARETSAGLLQSDECHSCPSQSAMTARSTPA